MLSTHSSSKDLEIREVPNTGVEMDDDRVIRGYPIVFNQLSLDLGGFKERILPQAVDRSMKADIFALIDHDTAKVLGRTTAGTLRLRKERMGLKIEIDPDPEISYAKDIMRAVGRRDVTGMSFGFRVLEDVWHEKSGQIPIRDVVDMEIKEFTIATFPAYPTTNVEVAKRSLQLHRQSKAYNWRAKWAEIQAITR